VAPQAATSKEPMKEKTPRVDWAELLKRTFDFDVFACVRCGGRRRVLAYVNEAAGVRAILEHLGLPTAGASRAKRAKPLPRTSWEGGLRWPVLQGAARLLHPRRWWRHLGEWVRRRSVRVTRDGPLFEPHADIWAMPAGLHAIESGAERGPASYYFG